MKVTIIKYLINCCILSGCLIGNVSLAGSFITANGQHLSEVPSNAVAVINYFSNYPAFSGTDYLKVGIDSTIPFCLYTDTACSLNSRCGYATSTPLTTTFNLASSSASYSLQFGLNALNNLAKQNGGSPANYKCLRVGLDYTTTEGTILIQDTPTLYVCQVASSGSGSSATFIGGGTGDGNPCGVPWTQLISPE